MNIAYTLVINRPLWIINYANSALRLYDNLPCQRSKILRYLNLFIEKSDAKAAYFPSLPYNPMPTSAYWIIPTSFPPSPIQATTFPLYFRNNSATLAFCVGAQRHKTTEFAFPAMLKNSSEWWSNTVCRLYPSMTSSCVYIFVSNYNKSIFDYISS